MRRKLLLLLVALGLFIVACGSPEPDPVDDPAPTSEAAAPTVDTPVDADLPDEITIAYFLEWPTPNQVAQIEETYDAELGVKVNWVAFDTGVAMSAAMVSGDVDIAYSQGLVPFANAVTSGLEIQAVGIAVSYAENDGCVGRADLNLTRDNITDLEGQQVAVPIGTVAHYKMLKELQYLGVDTDQLELVDLAPADGAAALQRGDVAMACGWGGGLARMKEAGNIIMTGAEMEEEIGLIVFDVVSVTNDFAENYPGLVTRFLQVTENANAAYQADQGKLGVIAQAAGMDEDATANSLSTFSFPNATDQLSDAWMGGTVQAFTKEVADFFVEQGELDAALDDYSATINTSFLEDVTPGDTWMGAMAADGGEMMESMERPDEITVAYFLEWPTPNQVAQLEETYDEQMGLKVNWVSFDTGVAMSAAMVSGDVDIAYSQGLVPFANAVTSGLEIKTVGIAVSYAENDGCVGRADLNLTRDNITDLHGEQVAVPIGTVAHYKMLKELQYLGVDTDQLELVDLAPADGAAALQRGDVAMACGWGGGLARMKEAGNIIMTGAEMEEEIGLIVFDVISVTDDFAANHGDIIVEFLQITEDANAAYNADQSKLSVIAQAAGMDEEATANSLSTFSFPNATAQLSDAWLGGTVQTFMSEVANFFVEQGELDEALPSYVQTVDTSFLEQVTPGDTWMGSMSAMTEDSGEMMVRDMPEDMADRPDELTVAYFLEWPTPNQVAQLEETYDSELGMKVNWVSFDTGVAMSAAMASGDVDIAYSQGLVPFANAVTSGLEIQAVGIAVSYAENDNCVVRTDLGITRDNATDLHGEQVAVPLGTVAHYKMLKEMAYLGVDVDQLEVVDLAPADGAAALQRGDVAMSCGWGGGLARMLEAGNVLMTGAEMEEEIGLIVFDVISVGNDFAEMHPSVVRDFLQVTEDANSAYAEDPSAEKLDIIAQAAGMDLDAAESNLATFGFPTRDEQLSDAWFGGTVQSFVTEVANFFVEQGELDEALDDYGPTINTIFLENVEG